MAQLEHWVLDVLAATGPPPSLSLALKLLAEMAPCESAMAALAQSELDLDPRRDLLQEPVTLDEVLDTIDARIQRRLATNSHPVYLSLAEQIERLRKQSIRKAEDSIEFLKQALARIFHASAIRA